MKYGSLTPSQFLKEHLRRSCSLNISITDHYFYRFIYSALDLIFFFNHCEFLAMFKYHIVGYGCKFVNFLLLMNDFA